MAKAQTHSHDHTTHQRHPEIGENKTIDFSVPWAKVDAAYQQILKKYQPHVKTDGFRKGKAPLKIVEQMVGPERLYQETAEKVLPEAYVDAVKNADAKPISDPEIHPTSLEMGKDWQFHAHIAEKPLVKLGKYQDIAKKAAKDFDRKQKEEVKKDTKKEEKPAEKDNKTNIEDQKLNAMMSAIRESVKPVIPELLIKQEAQYQLNQMSRQLQAYNIELKSYLASMGKNESELEQEYVGRALATWQIEVLIDAIAEDQKIEIVDKDIEEVIAKSKTNKVTDTQRIQMKSMLRKQKVFDYLLTLAQ